MINFTEVVSYTDESVSIKQVFMLQYVLNRAAAVPEDLGGDLAAEEALKAWDYINEECKTDE